ncbi:TIM44-like domain-containing protein [Labrys portucalensis]|uniref:TIM44-like domain-containing protein n=1 Tax=Labrys neptuniae TaxID=376174 RepID=A0ABV6ZEY8_9HYPH
MRFSKTRLFSLVTALSLAFTLAAVDLSEARRGGSIGSRGARTYDSVPATRTAPDQAAPVQRSMTPNPGPSATQPASPLAQGAAQQRPGLFGGAGGLMRGLLVGGLIGALLGYGFGGLAGMLGFLLQAALIAVIAFFAISWWRSRRTPSTATAGGPQMSRGFGFGNQGLGNQGLGNQGFNRDAQPTTSGRTGFFGLSSPAAASPARGEALETTQADLDTFEHRLTEVQDAFAKEDHAALRRLTTPEIVSYFSEELADNAKRGVRNDVRDTRLLQADIAEAWREGDEDYASAAFRYQSVDVLKDRTTGAIVEGKDEPSETTEIWTFVRRRGEDWKLSAIQEA